MVYYSLIEDYASLLVYYIFICVVDVRFSNYIDVEVLELFMQIILLYAFLKNLRVCSLTYRICKILLHQVYYSVILMDHTLYDRSFM